MQNRILLNREKYSQPTSEQIRGVTVQVFVSPYDVPTDVVWGYDSAIDRFAIDFHYTVADEPVEIGHEDETITLRVGKNSQRLYRIEVDTKRIQVNLVQLKVLVEKSVDKLIASSQKNRVRGLRTENYRIAREVIDEKADQLLSPALSR